MYLLFLDYFREIIKVFLTWVKLIGEVGLEGVHYWAWAQNRRLHVLVWSPTVLLNFLLSFLVLDCRNWVKLDMKLYALSKFFSEELNLEFKGIYCKIIELAAFIGWRVKCLLVHYHECFLQYLVVFPFFFLNYLISYLINQLFSLLEVFGGFFGV